MLSLLASIAAIPKQLFVEELPYDIITLNFSGTGSYTGTEFPYTINNMKVSMTNFDSTNFITTGSLWVRYILSPEAYDRIISFGRIADTKSHCFISYSGNTSSYDINCKINNSTLYNASVGGFSSGTTYNIFYTWNNVNNNINMRLYIYNLSGSLLFNGLNINYTTTLYNGGQFDEFDLYFENAFSNATSSGTLFIAAKFNNVLTTPEMETYSTQVL
jgi:hypothetical protein